MSKTKKTRTEQRKKRVRAKIFGTKDRPRLSVFRSSKYIYAQLINDEKGVTLLSVSEKNLDKTNVTKTERAKLVGNLLAQMAKKKKILEAVFDRGGYKYHGRIKALAEAARETGLKI